MRLSPCGFHATMLADIFQIDYRFHIYHIRTYLINDAIKRIPAVVSPSLMRSTNGFSLTIEIYFINHE